MHPHLVRIKYALNIKIKTHRKTRKIMMYLLRVRILFGYVLYAGAYFVQKWPCVQKSRRAKVSPRAKVTLVQKSRCVKLFTRTSDFEQKCPRAKVTPTPHIKFLIAIKPGWTLKRFQETYLSISTQPAKKEKGKRQSDNK